MKRMAVVGAGGIGSILGGYIAKGGEDITLICPSWLEHCEAMKLHGLKIQIVNNGEELIKVKALFIDELDQLAGKIDILFIAVKSYDTQKVLALMKPYLAEDAWVISCQNGINEDIIIPMVGKANTMGCIVTLSGWLLQPGCATYNIRPGVGFTVGELDGRITPRLKEIARIIGLCKETRITTNIWAERWTKLIQNCMYTTLAALTGMNVGELRKYDQADHVAALILVEAVKVAEASGYKIETASEIKVDLWKKWAQNWPAGTNEVIIRSGSKFGKSPGSMLTDVKKGRPTEIEYFNGYIVKRGRELGIPTPVNEMVVSIIKSVDSGQTKPGLDKLEYVLKRAL